MSAKELTPKQFRKMQLAQLDMLIDFDRVCRKHDINYVIFTGTLLGAVRHKGFIPWDDDADIGILREDYEKFKKVSSELNPEICYFQNHETDPEYRWEYGKLRRSNTVFVREGQERIECKTGIFVDIFPMDDVPKSVIGQMIQDFDCFLMRKTLYSEVGKYNSKGFVKMLYELLSKIPMSYVYELITKYTAKSNNKTNNKVRCLLFPAMGKLYKRKRKLPLKERYGMPKEWFLDRTLMTFEGHDFYVPKKYDDVLRYIYEDYMQLPPEDERQPHAPFCKIKFQDEDEIIQ